MPLFSANLGFLWTDRPLADAIRAAHHSGFDAVECHFPYQESVSDVLAALHETSFKMLGLNTVRGPKNAGMAALPGWQSEAQASIDQALTYANQISASNVHVMAGQIDGQAAENMYLENLRYASDQAYNYDVTILIEPLNPFDMPNYFLRDTTHALDIIQQLGRSNIKLMFDCYHVGRAEGDVIQRFDACLKSIGHVQFASVPDRGPPHQGSVDYKKVFIHIDRSGWSQPLGAEYIVSGPTENSLGWMSSIVCEL